MKQDYLLNINGMSLRDVNFALNLAATNENAITNEFRAEFNRRVSALKDRKRRLEFVENRRAAVDAAIRRNFRKGSR